MGSRSADKTLLLLCEAGQKNMDACFLRVEQAVEMVSAYVESDLDGLEDGKLQAHLDRVSDIFRRMTYNAEGILTGTFNRLTAHLKTYIGNLNDLAYADTLTGVHNKGAFDLYVQELEAKLREPEGPAEFAVCIFDCNELKKVNDSSGHDKGDLYLQAGCRLICRVFNHSPVFRIGGDEFAAVLLGADFRDREALVRRFDESSLEIRQQTEVLWEKVDIARGLAVYDPEEDGSVNDVVRRADRLMYENKWKTKHRNVPVM